MKNCAVVASRPFARIKFPDAPPLQGWGVRLLEDIPDAEYKKGDWMSQWFPNTNGVDFKFENELHMVFNLEKAAVNASDRLREGAEISTEVVKVG